MKRYSKRLHLAVSMAACVWLLFHCVFAHASVNVHANHFITALIHRR